MCRPFSGRAAIATAAVLLATVTSCSSPEASPPRGPTPKATSASAATTTSASPDNVAGQQAIAVYEGMWADFVAAGRTSDWESKRLGDHATGLAVTNMSRALYADKKNGLVTKGEPVLRPEVDSVKPSSNPTKVIITDCGDSSETQKYYAKTGKPLKGSPGGRHRINAVVEKDSGGQWKVTDYGVHEVGSC